MWYLELQHAVAYKKTAAPERKGDACSSKRDVPPEDTNLFPPLTLSDSCSVLLGLGLLLGHLSLDLMGLG